jgi:subtilisin family serine protease
VIREANRENACARQRVSEMKNWVIRSVARRTWRCLPLLGLALLGAHPGAASLAAAADEPRAKVEAAVLEMAALGETTFWVLLHEQASLAVAPTLKDHDARGDFVYKALRDVADRTQAPLRAELRARGARFQPFWIQNAIRVTGDESLALDLAARPEVKAIIAPRTYRIPEPIVKAAPPEVDAIGWNIEAARAHAVWSRYNVRGAGIVVAGIDTGVHYTHPALVRQYRGNLGGNFDHNYNWWDPSNICGNPSNAPCDNTSHGTHTMGTMVGDDGNPGPNQIGMAPHATWMACKGCETAFCSDFAVLSCGQFILAPTDLAGQNPQPALRPHVVNNSWALGLVGGDPLYAGTVDAWVASGIFPAFAIGNTGSRGCGSALSPGDYVASYAAGAFGRTLVVASFSSRGPSAFGGELKPNIAAPGVDVRSSVVPNGYAYMTGTSMASPHVAGTVALIWSRSQTVTRDVNATRLLLDNTARDVFDSQCGGTADDNNVWGEGRLNAVGAVGEAPLP